LKKLKKSISVTACFVLIFLMSSRTVTGQDAKSLVQAASKAMGIENVDSVMFYGSGANFNLGQSNRANGPWPRTNLNDYTRAIDFSKSASRATAVTWSAPVTGGAATQGAFTQNISADNSAWAQQLEIWITPWGFLKGAAANGATVKDDSIGLRKYKVVTWKTTQKSPSGKSYTVEGFINSDNLVDRVNTWIENPIFGDMLVQTLYTDYRDNNGFKFPASIEQKRGGWATFEAQILWASPNPANIQQLLTPPPPQRGAGGGTAVAGAPAAAPAAPAVKSEKLADGVYRINGAYNAMAIEFKDYIVLFEGGAQSEARSKEIIAEAKRVIPNKPIRYSILTHHHFDHSSGLPAIVAEGATIITHDVNKSFLEKALGARRTLAPDSMSASKNKPKIEAVAEKRVLQDEMRTVEIHHVIGLPHADGMLMIYLPKEKILAYADMFNLPPASDPVPNPPVVGTMVFLENIERLKLEPERIMSVHSLNPDRLATRADILKSLGRTN
jgi:glyoxylase-like metal-dependent hydrolase (beta-lactamase superfamily II)